MKKYVKIINTLTNQVDVGLGDNYTFYESIGMTLQDVEQAYDGCWYLSGYAPEVTIEEQNEVIILTRESLYASQVDPLHARKQRKLTVGTWTEDDEATYVAEVKLLSVQIETDNPYMEEV